MAKFEVVSFQDGTTFHNSSFLQGRNQGVTSEDERKIIVLNSTVKGFERFKIEPFLLQMHTIGQVPESLDKA